MKLMWTTEIQMKSRCDHCNYNCNLNTVVIIANLSLLKLWLQLRWSHLSFVCISVVQINFISRLILGMVKDKLNKLACSKHTCTGLHSSVGRGHGFKSPWSTEKNFSGSNLQLLKLWLQLQWSHLNFIR